MTSTLPLSRREIGRQYLCLGLLFLTMGIIGPAVFRFFNPPVEFNDDPRDLYNFFMIMIHGTMLVFFGIVPLLFSGFGNYIIPFPPEEKSRFSCLNFIGLILFYLSAGLLVVSLIARSPWTLALAMLLNIAPALFCSVIFVATIVWLYGSGINGKKIPFEVGTVFVTALLLFINFLPLEGAAFMRSMNEFKEMDFAISPFHSFRTEPPSIWRHIFWFMGHPEVYIILLFILGLIGEGFQKFTQGFFNWK